MRCSHDEFAAVAEPLRLDLQIGELCEEWLAAPESFGCRLQPSSNTPLKPGGSEDVARSEAGAMFAQAVTLRIYRGVDGKLVKTRSGY